MRGPCDPSFTQMMAAAAAAVFLFAQPQVAQASLVEDLLAKSAANKVGLALGHEES